MEKSICLAYSSPFFKWEARRGVDKIGENYMKKEDKEKITKREFLRQSFGTALAIGLGGAFTYKAVGSKSKNLVWQINPEKCTKCGRCATDCVLSLSAVKCVHNFSLCGYCKLCFGFFQPGAKKLNKSAENQICPTGAITRKFVEEPFFEYTIDESLCNGCGKCIKGCNSFGNGSLFLQVRHDRCLNCNECSISKVCSSEAFERIPVDKAYLLKGKLDED